MGDRREGDVIEIDDHDDHDNNYVVTFFILRS